MQLTSIYTKCRTLLLWLLLAVACFMPASALTVTAPETRVWQIFSIGYDAAVTEVTDGSDRAETPTSDYDSAPIHCAATEEIPTAAKRALFGQNAEFKAAESGTTLARTLGQAGEDAAGIVKNTERIPSLSGTASYRIPDELSNTMLGEVKNVGNLSYTSQLRDFNMFSQQNGLLFQLTVGPTTTLSPALQAEVANGNIVLKFLPKQ